MRSVLYELQDLQESHLFNMSSNITLKMHEHKNSSPIQCDLTFSLICCELILWQPHRNF